MDRPDELSYESGFCFQYSSKNPDGGATQFISNQLILWQKFIHANNEVSLIKNDDH